MAQLDNMIGFMSKLKATRLQVPSGHNCIVTTPAGERPLNRVLTLSEVQQLVEEVLPENCRKKYEAGGRFSFTYTVDDRQVAIGVVKSEDDLVLTIASDTSGLRQAAAPKPKRPPSAKKTTEAAPPQKQPPPAEFQPPPAETPAGPSAVGPTAVVVPAPATGPAPAPAPTAPPYQPADPDPRLVHLIETAAADNALDVLLLPDHPPFARFVDGVRPLDDFETLPAREVEQWVCPLAPTAGCPTPIMFARALGDAYRGRFTVNTSRHGLSASIRILPVSAPSLDELGVPEVVRTLCDPLEGLFLVCSRRGEGRTTTTAAIVDYLCRRHDTYIVTLSPTLEYLFTPERGLVSERALGSDPEAWDRSLEAVLEESPGIVVLEDLDTDAMLAGALSLAKAGIFVLGEARGTSSVTALSTIVRMLHHRCPVEMPTFTDTLVGWTFQVMCRSRAGDPVAAFEVGVSTEPIRHALQSGVTETLMSHVRASRKQGAVLLSETLLELVRTGVLSREEALRVACDKPEMQTLFQDLGRESGSSDDG